MHIEMVSESDAAELLEIYAPYVEETAISFECVAPTLKDFTQRIKTIREKYPYIKAVDDEGCIVGYAYAGTFKPRAAYDWSVEASVYVRREKRKQGVGRLLYEELAARLKEQGIRNMYACIASPIGDDEHLTNASQLFHEKMGFTLCGTFHKCAYKFGKPYNMIWMEKFLY